MTDGFQLLKGVIVVGKKYFETDDEDIYFNLNDVWVAYNTKCNFIDTIFGTIILNYGADYLAKYNDGEFLLVSVLLKVVDGAQLIMDISELARLYSVVAMHQDPYVYGHVVGKIAKLLT